ncbi:HET domain-containing protein [Colletotrichum salicis]|uniref:HET domain-containing protein n=1 Tax=Colletotrichum salicis TaxID=1209931 RepID=A0A135RXM9_9PEZI|nr:HET domain-containing protein [Colletotrichum salicis]
MRLLETTTLELSEFVEGHIPEYAILSHTWGDEEVLFRDLEKGPSAKVGWTKIQSACRIAREQGHSWIWIDTCCIDKASSSELSESINSMFRWYEQSAICLAYLSDVEYSEPETDECETALAKSRWFTRGWTLQELLAPTVLEFYAQDWTLLGPRFSFGDIIEQETGIGKKYLWKEWGPRNASIAERMSWASHRTTTRTEDTAYCLLGIFDINMPLIYGEGIKAFQRLQEAIIRDNDDQSIFAWGAILDEDTDERLLIAAGSQTVLPLLARSPLDFMCAGDVVPISNPIPSARVRIEHSGITIMTPLLAKVSSRWGPGHTPTAFLAPILCRRRSDVFNTIALSLNRTSLATPDPRNPEEKSYYRVSYCLSTFQMTAWASERLFPAFIHFQPTDRIHSRVWAPNGCAVRTLPKGYSLGAPYLLKWSHHESGGEKVAAILPVTYRLAGSYGLASPIVIPLRGPPVPETDGKGELALVLQYQYMSTTAGDEDSVTFEVAPSWMVNRVVTIPPGWPIAAVAHAVRAESVAWPAEYVRRISGASKRPESSGESGLLPDLFDRSSLKTFTRFHVGVSNEIVHGPLHIVDVVDLKGENITLEKHHSGSYTPVKDAHYFPH